MNHEIVTLTAINIRKKQASKDDIGPLIRF